MSAGQPQGREDKGRGGGKGRPPPPSSPAPHLGCNDGECDLPRGVLLAWVYTPLYGDTVVRTVHPTTGRLPGIKGPVLRRQQCCVCVCRSHQTASSQPRAASWCLPTHLPLPFCRRGGIRHCRSQAVHQLTGPPLQLKGVNHASSSTCISLARTPLISLDQPSSKCTRVINTPGRPPSSKGKGRVATLDWPACKASYLDVGVLL